MCAATLVLLKCFLFFIFYFSLFGGKHMEKSKCFRRIPSQQRDICRLVCGGLFISMSDSFMKTDGRQIWTHFQGVRARFRLQKAAITTYLRSSRADSHHAGLFFHSSGTLLASSHERHVSRPHASQPHPTFRNVQVTSARRRQLKRTRPLSFHLRRSI